MAMSPLIETAQPNASPAAASAAVSLWSCCPVTTSKRYAEPEALPASLLPECAPTMATSPLIETEPPNLALTAASAAVSLWVCSYSPRVSAAPGPARATAHIAAKMARHGRRIERL